MNPRQGGWFMALTFMVAATLSVTHLPAWVPDWTGWLRPEWATLVLFFWILETPHRVGLILVWSFGFLLDVLLSEPLGLNGLLLTSIALLGRSVYERLRMINVLQQSAVLFALVVALEVGKGIAVLLANGEPLSLAVLAPAAVTAFLWPFIMGPLQWAAWRAGTG